MVEPAGFQNTGLEWPQLLRQHSLLNMNLENIFIDASNEFSNFDMLS